MIDGVSSNAEAAVFADGGLMISGPVMLSILAELRVQTGLLQTIANTFDSLSVARSDEIANMGTLYTAAYATPLPSS